MSPDQPEPESPEARAQRRQKRFLDGFLANVPHMRELGIAYHAMGDNWVELTMPFSDTQVANPDYGIIASGAIFTLMDSVCGMASMLARGRLEPNATIDLRIDYLREPRPQATVIGRGECYRMTRQIAFVRGVAHDGDPEKPIAHVAGTFVFTPGAAFVPAGAA
jgi:uncharacterized protein (TIGR00369 family)